MDESREVEMEELLGRVTALTKELLEEGGEPHAIAFVLATTAADMGLSVTESPMSVFPLLLKAIALQADRRMQEEVGAEEGEGGSEDVGFDVVDIEAGATVH